MFVQLVFVMKHQVCHFVFKNALKRRKAGWNVLVWVGNECLFIGMPQVRVERCDLIPTMLQGIHYPLTRD